MTCRCPMCGAKNASHRGGRRHYARCNIRQDEHGINCERRSKVQTRRLLRRRDQRAWQSETF